MTNSSQQTSHIRMETAKKKKKKKGEWVHTERNRNRIRPRPDISIPWPPIQVVGVNEKWRAVRDQPVEEVITPGRQTDSQDAQPGRHQLPGNRPADRADKPVVEEVEHEREGDLECGGLMAVYQRFGTGLFRMLQEEAQTYDSKKKSDLIAQGEDTVGKELEW
jgi:hypothetical protein